MSVKPALRLSQFVSRIEGVFQPDSALFPVTDCRFAARWEIEVTRERIVLEAQQVLNDYDNDTADLPPGSMRVCLPSHDLSRRFMAKLRARFDRIAIQTRGPVIPLFVYVLP
jgi:hypothetical protein